MRLKLTRHWGNKNATLGTLLVLDENQIPVFSCMILERGFNENQRQESNVPSGRYKIVYEYSEKFGRKLWELKGVPNRAETKFHAANYWRQLKGCFAPGSSIKNLNKDAEPEVLYSANTLAGLHRVLENITETTIEIIDPI